MNRLGTPRLQALSDHYDRLREASYASRWALSNPGNRAALIERGLILRELVEAHGTPPIDLVVDLGCGSASIVPGIENSYRIGVDILFDRLAHDEHIAIDSLVNADGCMLPLREDSVDVVLLFTILSSVVDSDARRMIAAEVSRALRRDGVVLWYDLRYTNPLNRAMRPIGRRQLRKLFPGFQRELRSITLIPPISRRLGRFTESAYPKLTCLPFMRSHLVGALVKR